MVVGVHLGVPLLLEEGVGAGVLAHLEVGVEVVGLCCQEGLGVGVGILLLGVEVGEGASLLLEVGVVGKAHWACHQVEEGEAGEEVTVPCHLQVTAWQFWHIMCWRC